MDTDIEKESLKLVSQARLYNKWIFSLIEPHLNSPVLEVGSGIGTITRFILQKNRVLATEVDKEYIEILRNNFKSNKNFKGAIFLDLTKYKKIGSFETVVCTNVLHHIKNDTLAIANLSKHLKTNGHLILQEPAHMFLFGSLDKAQNHYRRYDKKNLVKKFQKNEFEIEQVFYFNLLGFFGWLFNSKLLKRSTISPSQIGLIDKFIWFTSRFERKIHLPFGLSVFVIARKVK